MVYTSGMARNPKQSMVIRLANNPFVRRLAIWVAPIVVGWITKKLTGSTPAKSSTAGRKYVKSKTK